MKNEKKKQMTIPPKQTPNLAEPPHLPDGYQDFLSEVSTLLAAARKQAARAVNTVLVATYWELGRRIIEFEQGGKERAGYGEQLLQRLSSDLGKRFGRGFSVDNLESMRLFYLTYMESKISQTMSRKLAESKKSGTPSRIFFLDDLMTAFPLSWSHYVLLTRRCRSDEARQFYHAEALRGGWSVRQLQRQIDSQFYERMALSKDKAALLTKERKKQESGPASAEETIKDPYVLEFLGLKDEYSENDLEEALIHHLETFLMELGSDFCFVGRQKRLRIGTEWYRVDLVFFHRRLRCLMLIDLKLGRFTHADAGQMHLYLNYAREHWTHADENPPVGLILCSYKESAVVKYALEGLASKVLAAEYRTVLPDEGRLAKEIEKTRRLLDERAQRKARDVQ
jgi:predicted nuclease of restriction endonuclease-like (RecB) superfamily